MSKKTKKLSPQVEASAERYRESVCQYRERIIELLKTLKPGKTLAEDTIYRRLGMEKLPSRHADYAAWRAAHDEHNTAEHTLYCLKDEGVLIGQNDGFRLTTDKDRERMQAEDDELVTLERVACQALGKNTADTPVHAYGYGISINGPALEKLKQVLKDAGLL